MSNIEFSSFANKAAYDAATKPTEASRISIVSDTEAMMIDGVNVVTTEPVVGDVLFVDGSGNKVFMKGGDEIVAASVPDNLTLVGYVFRREGRYVWILNKTDVSLKYAAYAEYSITAISSAEVTINLRLSNDYNTNTSTTVTLTDTSNDYLNATNAGLINDAIVAKCTEVSATNVPWAYYDTTNNKIVIVVEWKDYRQYNVSGTGCTIALSIWDDMPVTSTNGVRVNNINGNERIMNAARGAAYYNTHGRTPTAVVGLNESGGIITEEAFNGEYGATLRNAYGTYTEYIKQEYYVKRQQKIGVFSLADPKELTEKYGNRQVRLADGTYAYAFPALHHPLTVSYDSEGLQAGDWYLHGVDDGTEMLRDDVYAILRKSQGKMGTTQISNSASRWFAQRNGVTDAWFFYGGNGGLSGGNVLNTFRVQAVLLLKI